MQEVTAIVGLSTDTGKRYTQAEFEHTLMQHFEGATVQYGRGVWQGTLEDCAIVTVAGAVREVKRRFLALGRALKQHAIVLRLPSGTQIIAC